MAVPPAVAGQAMRFAYADPPYPGQAKRWYGNHPDYAGEVDHAELVARLERDYPDGWALSTSMTALQYVLSLCPDGALVAVWQKTNPRPAGAKNWRWWFTWEPVIVCGGRPNKHCQDLLLAPAVRVGMGGEIIGQKPHAFAQWVWNLLGGAEGDTIDDLFRGSGACASSFDSIKRQRTLWPSCRDTIEPGADDHFQQCDV